MNSEHEQEQGWVGGGGRRCTKQRNMKWGKRAYYAQPSVTLRVQLIRVLTLGEIIIWGTILVMVRCYKLFGML